MMPWKLIADPSGYIFKWLLGYSGGLGSIAGVLICDYWILHKTELSLPDLYQREGKYAYGSPIGTNWNAIAATLVGCFFAWIGVLVDSVHVLFDYAWFVGAFGAAFTYFVLEKMLPHRAAKPSSAQAS